MQVTQLRDLAGVDDGVEVAEALAGVFDRGLSRPERSFVGRDREGRMVGLIAFSEADPVGGVVVELLHLPWHADYRAVGQELLEASAAQLPSRATSLEYILDEPHEWHPHPEARRRLLTRLGFEVVRRTRRWEWRSTVPIPTVADSLVYRTVASIGRDGFEAAFRRVVGGSLDRRLASEDSARQAALLLSLDHDPGGYALAYDPAGNLVGLWAAAHAGTQPIIALIGVVPERRGEGHGFSLLIAATRHQGEVANAATIRADTDELNEPMTRCFMRAGYEQFAIREEWRRPEPLR